MGKNKWADKILLAGAISLGLIILASALADCQEFGHYLVMDRANLEHAENFLAGYGHRVRAFDGTVLGLLRDRETGTGTALVRGRDQHGHWRWWVFHTYKGLLVKMNTYPAKCPKKFKGE